MTTIPFRRLPFAVRLGSMLGLLAIWVEIEEFGIDRFHLDVYLPFYRVGRFCVYDFAVLIGLGALWAVLSSVRDSTPSPS